MSVLYAALSYLFIALPFVMVVVFALLIWVVLLGAYSSVLFGVWFAICIYLLGAAGGGMALSVGLNLSIYDIGMILLGLVAMLRLVQGKMDRADPISKAWMLLGFVWFSLFAIGTVLYKTQAGLQFREPYYFWVATAYLMTFSVDEEQVQKVLGAFYFAAILMASLAIFRWGLCAAGEYGDWYDFHTPLRVLNSAQAQLVAIGAVPGVAMWMGLTKKRSLWMLLSPLLLLIVVILGHRTVWIATAAALVTTRWIAARTSTDKPASLLVPLLVGGILIGGVFVLAPESTVSRELVRSVDETTQKNSTIAWRQDSWKATILGLVQAGPAVWPAGKPFGSDNTRFIESQGMETHVAVHSHYVALLQNGGLVGIVAFLLAQFLAMKRLLIPDNKVLDPIGTKVFIPLLVLLLVYGVAYSLDYMQGLLMGLCFSIAIRQKLVPASDTDNPDSIHIHKHDRHAYRRHTYLS